MTLHGADLLISILTFFIAYLTSATIVNIFHAWVAHKMGDDTGVYSGFLTLNPFFHIDPIGLMFLFVISFGWFRSVPINPHNIYGSYRVFKVAAAYLANVFAHFVLS